MSVKFIISVLVCFISFSSLSQQLNRMVLENWSNGVWENKMRQLPRYDDEGRIIKKEIALWNAELMVWEDQTKTVFSRDENGILLKRETFDWLKDQSIWQATTRASYTINSEKKPTTVLNEVRDAEGWYNKSIDEYVYDANGGMIEKRSERWDKQLTSWIPDMKFDYTRESDRTAGYTVFFWDNHLEAWQEYKKAQYFYTEDETIDHILFESWIDGNWKEYSHRRNSADEEGRLNTMEVDKFDPTSESWIKASHVDYELTDFDKISESIHKKWNSELSKWESLQRSTCFYSKDGKMIEEPSQSNPTIELFPNPTMESLTIRSLPVGTITIIDALGKIVLRTNNADSELQLDVSKWEIGAYSIQVNGTEIQKFVKQ